MRVAAVVAAAVVAGIVVLLLLVLLLLFLFGLRVLVLLQKCFAVFLAGLV